MQPKKYVTKNQLKTIFDSNPSANRVEILDEFLNQGYVVEGYNEPKPNLAQKIADVAIGGASNLANTAINYTGAAIDQATGMSGAKTFKESYDRLAQFSETDPKQNVGAQTILGRNNISRDLSTGKGWEQLGGDALSTAATVMPAGKVMQGATLGAKVAQGAKVGATVGAVGGAGTSMQEGNSLGEVAKDTAIGAGAGAAIGGAIPAVGAGISKGAELTKQGTQKVFSLGKDSVGAIKYNHIDPQVAESATRLAGSKIEPNKLYSQFKNAQELATIDVKKPSALEIVGNDIGDAFDNVISKRKEAGKVVGAELQKIGNTPVQVDDIISPYAKNVMGELKKVATGKQSKFSADEIEMLSKFDLELKTLGKNPTAEDVGSFLTRIRSEIDSLKGKKNIMGVTNADRLMTEVTSNLNSRIANNFPQYAAAKSEYARLSDLLEEGVGYLGKKTIGGDYKKETSIVKSSLNSILNGGKKDFLVQLEKETGRPILDKAVIAGQVMRDLGDARGESLLQKLTDESIKGRGYKQIAAEWAANKVLGDESKRTMNYLSDLPAPNISKMNANTNIATGMPTYQMNAANNIPPAISNISDIIKHSPELAKSAIIEMAKGLPTAIKNQIIKELVDLANE